MTLTTAATLNPWHARLAELSESTPGVEAERCAREVQAQEARAAYQRGEVTLHALTESEALLSEAREVERAHGVAVAELQARLDADSQVEQAQALERQVQADTATLAVLDFQTLAVLEAGERALHVARLKARALRKEADALRTKARQDFSRLMQAQGKLSEAQMSAERMPLSEGAPYLDMLHGLRLLPASRPADMTHDAVVTVQDARSVWFDHEQRWLPALRESETR